MHGAAGVPYTCELIIPCPIKSQGQGIRKAFPSWNNPRGSHKSKLINYHNSQHPASGQGKAGKPQEVARLDAFVYV